MKWVDVNINIPISGHLLKYIKNINKVIVKAGNGDINFFDCNKVFPHITLVCGRVSDKNLKKVIYLVEECSKKSSKFNYTISAPYLVRPHKKFCFINIIDYDKIYSIKKDLDNKIDGLIKYNKFGTPDTFPHITIGYIRKKIDIHNFDGYAKMSIARKINISMIGKRGVCIGFLNSFNLE